jgi:hypothetical protein
VVRIHIFLRAQHGRRGDNQEQQCSFHRVPFTLPSG